MNVLDQVKIDRRLVELDGTDNKGNLGANALLGVSLACARCASNALDMPLYRYIGGINAKRWPMPMMNVINGGVHAILDDISKRTNVYTFLVRAQAQQNVPPIQSK